MNWQKQLITLYLYICNEYEKELWAHVKRHSAHADLSFTDEEVLTLYLFGIMEKRYELKEIYAYADRHLRDWFPLLPQTYVGFVQRVNRVADAFVPLIEKILRDYPEQEAFKNNALLTDSMPIMLAQRGRRFKAKVAPEIADSNGYCATKKMHYYGVKLHVVGQHRKSHLPMPTHMGLTPAGMHDQKAFEQVAGFLPSTDLYADKAYTENSYSQEANVNLMTPVKKQKGQERLDTQEQWLSTAVSRVRQPIESFFNWLQEKTHIQLASKVRSYAGLMVHVFGRIAAALCSLILLPCS